MGLKNMKFMFIVLISIIFVFPNIVNAELINNNGIVISDEEYNNFLKVYDEDYIMNMSLEKYNKLVSLNFENITTSTKYYETTYNQNLQLTTQRELTEEEYNNIVAPALNDGSAFYETTYKELTLDIIGGSTWNWAIAGVTWKAIPSTRSFDVIGFNGIGFDFGMGTQAGEQIYTLNGEYTRINYSWNGTNIKRFENGFGISMNIVNSDITHLQALVEVDVRPNLNHPTLYASYQHAQTNLTLADSQNYTIGGSGLGNVFIFPYSIAQKYDGMCGVTLAY